MTTVDTTPVKKKLGDSFAEAREKIHKRFLEAFEKANEAFTPERISTEISNMLTSERRQIVLRLLGLTDRWDKFEYDNEATRNAKTPLKNYIEQHAQTAIDEWMEKELREVFITQATALMKTDKFKKDMQRQFTDSFYYKYNNRVRELANELAEEEAKKALTELKKQLSMAPPE